MTRRSQRGSASVEFLGALPLLLVAALAALQLLVTTATVTATQTAARAGSRTAGLGASPGTARAAARDALPGWLRDGSVVSLDGTAARVVVELPVILPGLSSRALTVTRRAELPEV